LFCVLAHGSFEECLAPRGAALAEIPMHLQAPGLLCRSASHESATGSLRHLDATALYPHTRSNETNRWSE
jgi:hypothetical protein